MGQVLSTIRAQVDSSTSHAQLEAALRWLHLAGSIILCPRTADQDHEEDLIFIDPTWLCSRVVGRAVASKALLSAQGIDVPWEDGHIALRVSQLQALGSDLVDSSTTHLSGEQVASVLTYFGIGRAVKDRVFIPMRLQAGLSASTRHFLRERSASILGRELVARPPNIFVPGFFPLLQLKAFERTGTFLWKGGVSLTCGDGDDTVGTIEALGLRDEAKIEDTHITRLLICIYSLRELSSAGTVQSLRAMLELCLKLVEDTLRELLPGLDTPASRVDTFVVGPGCIRTRLEELTASPGSCRCPLRYP
jgi:hypothetical protein